MHAMSSAVATAIFRRACRLFRMMQLVICSIIQNCLTALIRLYKANGLVAKEKRMGGHKNNVRAHSLADLEWVVAFITNYADDHGLALLGRIPGCETACFVRDEGESAWRYTSLRVCKEVNR